ncbi:MAG: GNAT family N-acetyltransferase [Myxococcota bacterium]
MSVSLQVLTADDWRIWRDLRLAALRTDPQAFSSTVADWADADEARWRGRLSLPGGRDLVARLDGVPVGMATGLLAASEVSLLSMWVAPSARGHGVGDALMRAVADWARTRGADTLTLDVVEGNAAAVALYKRHGLVDVGPAGAGERRMRLDL